MVFDNLDALYALMAGWAHHRDDESYTTLTMILKEVPLR